MPELVPNPAESESDVSAAAITSSNVGDSSERVLVEGDEITLELDRIATGGAALGLGPDGAGSVCDRWIPGETVTAKSPSAPQTRRSERGPVLEGSSDRVEPSCATLAAGCGGCDWQHIEAERQRLLRRDVVVDCLSRLGGLPDADVRLGPSLEVERYRTTVRAAVVGGKAAYRMAASHDTVPIEQCEIAHPLVEELLTDGFFGDATEVVVR